jgi:iron complex transport system permease protein
MLRLVIGPAHGPLIVASALGGALLLVMADLVARTILAPAEVPVGLITALVGGPLFLILIVRMRRTWVWL